MTERGTAPPRITAQLQITNRLGLHARAAALLVQTASRFDAAIAVTKENQTVDGRSIIGLMMLAAGQGSTIQVAAEGPDAGPAIEAIAALVEARFNEDA